MTPRQRSTAARGYGNEHQKMRKIVARQVERGEAMCARCGGWIAPGTPWHLDHDDLDRSHYIGPSHEVCNLRAARRRAAARSGSFMPVYNPATRHVPRRRSQEW